MKRMRIGYFSDAGTIELGSILVDGMLQHIWNECEPICKRKGAIKIKRWMAKYGKIYNLDGRYQPEIVGWHIRQ